MAAENKFKYFAFISYSAEDTKWGKKVQRKLENYRMPAAICKEHGWKRTPINPVFFAPTDIQPGDLTEELQERLRSSRNLIVICSPNSAKSIWVGKEIEFFHNLGRTNNIHFFIVDGVPNSGDSKTECFNSIIETLDLPEFLGANINEKIYRFQWLNKERAFVQLVSKLLGVEYDAIWQRHKRRLVNKILSIVALLVAMISALICIWIINRPVDVTITLHESSAINDKLPPLSNAIVVVSIDNETKTDTIHTQPCKAVFHNIPHRFLNKKVHTVVNCCDFITVDTMTTLHKDMVLNIYRDPMVYGNIHFRLYDPERELGVPKQKLIINGFETNSDNDGFVSLYIPLELQDRVYTIKASRALISDTIIMPCGDDDVVLIR